MAGSDRYFGGREGEASKARDRLHREHGPVKGEREFQDVLAARRGAYAGRGRGTALQREVFEPEGEVSS